MLRIITLSLTLVLLIACQNSINKTQITSGKDIFKQNCVLCHGIKGDLMTNGAKNLSLSEMSLEERILIISQGRNVMTGFEGKLSSEEIKAVAEFSQSLKTN